MPSPNPYRVLFLCTGNSARSILAEFILNHRSGGRFEASGNQDQSHRLFDQVVAQIAARIGLFINFRDDQLNELSAREIGTKYIES